MKEYSRLHIAAQELDNLLSLLNFAKIDTMGLSISTEDLELAKQAVLNELNKERAND